MKHKKIFLILIFVLIVGISTLLYFVVEENKKRYQGGNSNIFAIMLEDIDGKYIESDLDVFPDNYIYNGEKSYCINGTNLTWDEDNRTISMSATNSEKCYVYFDILTQDFVYTGNYQVYTVGETGIYKVELWGASGSGLSEYIPTGSYTSGNISLNKGEKLYVYVGQDGNNIISAYNAGGTAYSTTAGSGGGATDIRLESGEWNSTIGLNSRIMVAAGAGGGSFNSTYIAGFAGGLIGYTAYTTSYPDYTSGGGTQISGGIVNNYSSSYIVGTNGSFGISGSGGGANTGGGASGGGGYYGGAGGSRLNNGAWPSGGGSSYISGHTGAVAITSASDQTPKSGCTTGTTSNLCSIHYSGKVFTNTVMIDGAGYNWTNGKKSQVLMPNILGGTYELGVGHSGHGYAKITFMGYE